MLLKEAEWKAELSVAAKWTVNETQFRTTFWAEPIMPEGRATSKRKKGQARLSQWVNSVGKWCQEDSRMLQLVLDSAIPHKKRGVEDGEGRYVNEVSLEEDNLTTTCKLKRKEF